MSIFFVEKKGVYGHGVFWIGSSKEEGMKIVDFAAENDSDDYHDWILKEFVEQSDFDNDAKHKLIYAKIKGGRPNSFI